MSWRKVKQGREQGCWRAAGPGPRGERPRPPGWRSRPSCLARSRGPRPAPGVWRSHTLPEGLGGAARRGRLVPVHGGRRCPGSRVPSTLAAGSRGARCGDVCFPFASSFHKRTPRAPAARSARQGRPPSPTGPLGFLQCRGGPNRGRCCHPGSVQWGSSSAKSLLGFLSYSFPPKVFILFLKTKFKKKFFFLYKWCLEKSRCIQ